MLMVPLFIHWSSWLAKTKKMSTEAEGRMPYCLGHQSFVWPANLSQKKKRKEDRENWQMPIISSIGMMISQTN